MLTDTALRNLKLKSKIYKASDRDGMYVTVSPTGTVTFRYDYRLNRRRETLTIGRYGPAGISLALAREKLIDAKKAVAHPLVRFVGLDGYEAAGGGIRRDLFAEGDAGVYLTDAALLERLAQDKLAGIAAAMANRAGPTGHRPTKRTWMPSKNAAPTTGTISASSSRPRTGPSWTTYAPTPGIW